MRKMILSLIVIFIGAGIAFAKEDYDFRNAKWGMSSRECFDSEKFKNGIIKDDYDELLFKCMLLGHLSQISYKFKENKLCKGDILIRVDKESDAQKIFELIRNKLSLKQGKEKKISFYHNIFITKTTNIILRIYFSGDSFTVITHYEVSDLENIGLEKHIESIPNKQDLEIF